MATATPAASPTPDEREAMRVLLFAINAEDADVAWRRQTSKNRTYDADLHFQNGDNATVELTSSDGEMKSLASADNRVYKTQYSKSAWTIAIRPHSCDGREFPSSTDMRAIVKDIDSILADIEREYQLGVDPRLYDPNLYDGIFQSRVRQSDFLSIKIIGSRSPDDIHPAGVRIALHPTASLRLDNTDVLAARVQGVIDKKHERGQGATWLVVQMRDYGGAADQLRELQITQKNQPASTEHLNRIDLKSFAKVFVYAKKRNGYAVLSIDRYHGWNLTTL